MTDGAPVIRCLSPAKLNLFLYITGRRPDGYHNLQTLFTILDYGDEMEFVRTGDPAIALLTDFGFPATQNLIYKAALKLQQLTGTTQGVRIRVQKRLPSGGGLGGGSGNAATALLVLNALWQLGLSREELEKIALELGSDVPVFVHGCPAFAEGRGEIFTDVDLDPAHYVVAVPSCHVATAELFADPALERDRPSRPLNELMQEPWGNVFEPVVCRRYPEVARILSLMQERGLAARLTGSGGCCFARLATAEAAREAQGSLQRMGITAFVSRDCRQSPTVRALAEQFQPCQIAGV